MHTDDQWKDLQLAIKMGYVLNMTLAYTTVDIQNFGYAINCQFVRKYIHIG